MKIIHKLSILSLAFLKIFSLHAGVTQEELNLAKEFESEVLQEILTESKLEILPTQVMKFPYLEAMEGNMAYLPSLDGTMTYSRQSSSIRDISVLRKKIKYAGDGMLYGEEWCGIGYKKIGEEYSQRGGCFITKIDFEEKEEAMLNCFAYALSTFGEKLESLAQKSMDEIQRSVSSSIDQVVESYFESILDEPEDGDLVIYKSSGYYIKGQFIQGITHAGVYRKINSDSHVRGTVESKWGWLLNPYVFIHDVFFVPSFYGETMQFYRLKKNLDLFY